MLCVFVGQCAEGFGEWGGGDAVFGDDAGDVFVGGYVESGVADIDACGSDWHSEHAGDFDGGPFFDGNL